MFLALKITGSSITHDSSSHFRMTNTEIGLIKRNYSPSHARLWEFNLKDNNVKNNVFYMNI